MRMRNVTWGGKDGLLLPILKALAECYSTITLYSK